MLVPSSDLSLNLYYFNEKQNKLIKHDKNQFSFLFCLKEKIWEKNVNKVFFFKHSLETHCEITSITKAYISKRSNTARIEEMFIYSFIVSLNKIIMPLIDAYLK